MSSSLSHTHHTRVSAQPAHCHTPLTCLSCQFNSVGLRNAGNFHNSLPDLPWPEGSQVLAVEILIINAACAPIRHPFAPVPISVFDYFSQHYISIRFHQIKRAKQIVRIYKIVKVFSMTLETYSGKKVSHCKHFPLLSVKGRKSHALGYEEWSKSKKNCIAHVYLLS